MEPAWNCVRGRAIRRERLRAVTSRAIVRVALVRMPRPDRTRPRSRGGEARRGSHHVRVIADQRGLFGGGGAGPAGSPPRTAGGGRRPGPGRPRRARCYGSSRRSTTRRVGRRRGPHRIVINPGSPTCRERDAGGAESDVATRHPGGLRRRPGGCRPSRGRPARRRGPKRCTVGRSARAWAAPTAAPHHTARSGMVLKPSRIRQPAGHVVHPG